MTEPHPGPLNELACQCYLYITASISWLACWTAADLSALYWPEGHMALLTWHVNPVLLVRSDNLRSSVKQDHSKDGGKTLTEKWKMYSCGFQILKLHPKLWLCHLTWKKYDFNNQEAEIRNCKYMWRSRGCVFIYFLYCKDKDSVLFNQRWHPIIEHSFCWFM